MKYLSWICFPLIAIWTAPVLGNPNDHLPSAAGSPYVGYIESGYIQSPPIRPQVTPISQRLQAPAWNQVYAQNDGAAANAPEVIQSPDGTTPDNGHVPGHYDSYGSYYAASGNCASSPSCYNGHLNWRSVFDFCGWYGTIGGLAMTRDLPNRQVLTSEVGFPNVTRMTNRDADVDWEGGFEITFGRCITENLRWEVGYWTLNPFSGFANVLDPGGFSLNTPLDFDNVFVGGGIASDFFDGSAGHEIYREDELHNIEWNLYFRPCCFGGCSGCAQTSCCCPWNFEFLTGVRFLKFDEYFIFAGVTGGSSFGANGGADELYVESEVENNLIGWQLGALLEYCVRPNWVVYARPKFGVYGNHTSLDFDVRRGDNGAVVTSASGDTFPIRSTENDVAFLGEIDLGVRWEFGSHWSAYAGYRAVAVSGIALSDEQIPFLLADTASIRDIDSNGSLILHGAMLGLQFQY